jgi:hypothetical protein
MKYFIALLFLITCDRLYAGTISYRLYAHPDTDTLVRKMSVTAGISYGSDVQFFGRTGPITYPFASTDVIYNTKGGLFLYGSALKVLGYNPMFDEIDLGGGYFYHYSQKSTGSISYTRFLFNRDAAQIIKSASSNDFNFKNTYDWGFAKSAVILDYLFGKESDFFVTLNTYKHFESKWNIFDDKDYLTFDPGITAILGTQNFVQEYTTGPHFRIYNDDDPYPPGGPNDPNDPDYARHNSWFNALNYSVKLPIAYNRPHYTLEFAYKYSIPVNVEGLLRNRRESFYNLTFFYVFY